MSYVAALYRYPVKGFTPESCTTLTVLPEGRIVGDRVLALRFANTAVPDTHWGHKQGCVALMNTPGLARFRLHFDHHALRVRIDLDGERVLDEGLDETGRQRIAAVLGAHITKDTDNPLSAYPERLPLRLVGDGQYPRYQDNAAGQISMHSRESLDDLAVAAGVTELSGLRFRSNIVIAGVSAWNEQAWIGRNIRIGAVDFAVLAAKTRCLAIQANPQSGIRDCNLLAVLKSHYQQAQPTFAVSLMPSGAGGNIGVGDTVTVLA